MSAPATAPTGPSTTAPDTAPTAALPARSCAFALNEKIVAAIAAATSSFFIAVPLDAPQRQGTARMRQQEGRAAAATVPIQGARFKIAYCKSQRPAARGD